MAVEYELESEDDYVAASVVVDVEDWFFIEESDEREKDKGSHKCEGQRLEFLLQNVTPSPKHHQEKVKYSRSTAEKSNDGPDPIIFPDDSPRLIKQLTR